MASSILEVDKVTKYFRGLKAVSDYSLALEKGVIAGLIGPNGAGKTTVFNLLTGVFTPTSGTIRLHQQDIAGQRLDQIVGLGMARTFQNLRLFTKLTVLDNVLVAAQINKDYGFWAAIAGLPSFKKGEKDLRERASVLLEDMGLLHLANELSGNLPYGDQRKLEIARALATGPKVLLLDEPAAGMNPRESQELTETIRIIRDKYDLTILLIEHDMHVVMNLCDNIQVLSYGEIIAAGKPADIRSNQQVIEAYLGRAAANA